MLTKSVLSAVLGAFLLLFCTPAVSLAEHRGGEHGRSFSGGHGYSGAQGNWGARSYSGRSYSGRSYSAPSYSYRGGEHFRGYYRGRDWDRGYYRGGGFGLYVAPYSYYGPAYGYSYCDPSGYYDDAGYWHPYPGCAYDPY